VSGAFVWLEQSALGEFMRTSSLWTYPVVNLLHVFGIAALFGAAAIIDLRLLGAWRRVPLRSVTDVAVPVAAVGLLLALVTGAGLFATQATEYLGNPFLFIKFAAIAVGLANAAAVRALPAWQARGERDLTPAEHRRLALVGGLSLASWIAAVTAGRLIAYW
jgi:hypothetical protein